MIRHATPPPYLRYSVKESSERIAITLIFTTGEARGWWVVGEGARYMGEGGGATAARETKQNITKQNGSSLLFRLNTPRYQREVK